jgi:hypothetical protein
MFLRQTMQAQKHTKIGHLFMEQNLQRQLTRMTELINTVRPHLSGWRLFFIFAA